MPVTSPIADRPEPVACTAVFVDKDLAPLTEPRACFLKSEARCARLPSRAEDDDVGTYLRTVVEL